MSLKIIRTEKHTINKSHKMWKICDELCFKSKNLYNYANYVQRQSFIDTKKIINSVDIQKLLKTHETFKELGSNSAQQTLQLLDKAWKSFFISIKDYWKNPSKYLGKPHLPNYKDKMVGMYVY